MKTFEKRGANFRNFTKRAANLKKNSNFEAKIRVVNTVSGEKLHDFEIICPARGLRSYPHHPLSYGPGIMSWK